MLWQLGNSDRVSLLAGGLAESMAVAHVHRNSPLKVRERESGLSIAAVSRSKERKQGLVLVDGKELAIAERPPFGREAEAEHSDF